MSEPEHTAAFPSRESLLPVTLLHSVHPSLLDEAILISQCDNRFQRRSGPGGQHRNKTSSGVFLTHRPSGLVAEATERRSQVDNRSVSLRRLRFLLAVHLRTPSVFDQEELLEIEKALRLKFENTDLKMRESHPDRPAVLAVLLNDLHVAGGQPSLVAAHWAVTTSAINRLLKSCPEAFSWVNACRDHHGKKPLR